MPEYDFDFALWRKVGQCFT